MMSDREIRNAVSGVQEIVDRLKEAQAAEEELATLKKLCQAVVHAHDQSDETTDASLATAIEELERNL